MSEARRVLDEAFNVLDEQYRKRLEGVYREKDSPMMVPPFTKGEVQEILEEAGFHGLSVNIQRSIVDLTPGSQPGHGRACQVVIITLSMGEVSSSRTYRDEGSEYGY